MHTLRFLISFIRYIFLFRKPQFAHLDFVDLVIDNKPIFIVAWQIKRATSIRISTTRKKYRKKEGSLLMRIPQNTQSIVVTASNLWRTKKQTIYLRHVTLDDSAATYLIKQLSPITTLQVQKAVISVTLKPAVIKKTTRQIKPFPVPSVKLPVLSLAKFKYP